MLSFWKKESLTSQAVSGKVAIIGYAGHAYVVAEAAREAKLHLGYYCEKQAVVSNPFQLDYLGDEGDADFAGWNGEYQYILGIGDNNIRHKVALKLLNQQQEILNVIHPAASLSKMIKIGIGNFISRQAAVNVMASIGNFCILNTGCIVEHECQLGDAVHIAPGAVLAGSVQVGDFSFIGANSVVKQGVKIGSNVIVGAGAVVIRDVPDGVTVVGNPGYVRFGN